MAHRPEHVDSTGKSFDQSTLQEYDTYSFGEVIDMYGSAVANMTRAKMSLEGDPDFTAQLIAYAHKMHHVVHMRGLRDGQR